MERRIAIPADIEQDKASGEPRAKDQESTTHRSGFVPSENTYVLWSMSVGTGDLGRQQRARNEDEPLEQNLEQHEHHEQEPEKDEEDEEGRLSQSRHRTDASTPEKKTKNKKKR